MKKVNSLNYYYMLETNTDFASTRESDEEIEEFFEENGLLAERSCANSRRSIDVR